MPDKPITQDAFRARLLYVLFFTALVALTYLHDSELSGRLAADLAYDDVSYAHEAVQRLLVLEEQGGVAFFRHLIEHPPHSVSSSILALSAFKLGGISEFSLYASNTAILLLLGAFIAFELKDARRTTLAIALAFVMFSPLAYRAIHDFRPDIALGLATAVMTIWYARGIVYRDDRSIRNAGLMFGLCLLIKPTFFAHTIAIAMFLAGLSATNLLLRHVGLAMFQVTPISRILQFIGIGVLVGSPYFIVNGRQIFNYFWTNTRGESSSIWSFAPETPLLELLGEFHNYAFHIVGYHNYLAAFVIIVAGGVLIVFKRFAELKQIALQLIVSCISFAIIVFGRHKNEFFLASSQWILVLTAVFAYAYAAQRLQRKGRAVLTGLMAVGILVTSTLNSDIKYWTNSQETLRGSSWNEVIFQAIRHDFVSSVNINTYSAAPTIFVSFAGYVNSDTLRWIGYREHFLINPMSTALTNDLEAARSSAMAADYVVIPNQARANYNLQLPSAVIQTVFFKWIVNNPVFEPMQGLNPERHYFIFRNKTLRETRINQATVKVDGLPTLDGFLQEEGPYPMWSLPKVRWMSKKEARLCIFEGGGGRHLLTLRMRPNVSGVLEIFNNGKVPIGKIRLQRDVFQDAVFEFDATESPLCVDFLLQPSENPRSDRLVLFSRIELRVAK